MIAPPIAEPSVIPRSTTTPSAPAPAALAICKKDIGTEPLSALCELGADASHANFECKDPQPYSFCKKQVIWGCTTMALAGEKAPPITFEARGDMTGPPLKDREIIDTKALIARFPRRGPIRGVAIHFETTDATAEALVAGLNTKFTMWGCIQSADKAHFDCGTWTAAVKYYDIMHKVYVEAGEPGAFDCN